VDLTITDEPEHRFVAASIERHPGCADLVEAGA